MGQLFTCAEGPYVVSLRMKIQMVCALEAIERYSIDICILHVITLGGTS